MLRQNVNNILKAVSLLPAIISSSSKIISVKQLPQRRLVRRDEMGRYEAAAAGPSREKISLNNSWFQIAVEILWHLAGLSKVKER